MSNKDPGNSQPEDFTTEEDADDPTENPNVSESSGMIAGSALGKPEVDTSPAELDPEPDRRGVVEGAPAVDVDDDQAVLDALANGRRDLVDPSKMTLERRMRFGLLTREDDEARVAGRLGNHMTSSRRDDPEAGGRTNVYDNLPGGERDRG
jgi:hypothetical protein